LRPDAGVVTGGCEPKRPEHTRETTQCSGEDEQPELDSLDADPGEEGSLLAGTDGEDRATERRCVQDDGEDDGERQEERDRVRDVRAGDRNDADARQT